MSKSPSLSAKQIEVENNPAAENENNSTHADTDDDGDHCSICLQLILDRALIPECSHDEFCFECLVVWTGQSRRCPLCTRTIGPYLLHNIRSRYDYAKYHLPPLRSSPPPIEPLRPARRHVVYNTAQGRRWGRRARIERDTIDELERAINKRRWVYRHHLYAKHVASNTFTRYRPFPTPSQFSASQDYMSRATSFIRRELRVWVNLDVEFLTTFILSLMKVIDIRSESAIKLLAEFLDMDMPYVDGQRSPNAEHFAHELYSYLRSPFKSLASWDTNVQYDAPESFPDQPTGSSSSVVRQRNNDGHLASPSRLNPSGSEPQRHKAHHPRSRTAVPDNEPGPSSLSLGTMIEYTHGSKCTIFSDDITGPCQMSGNPTNNRVFSEPMEDWKCISRESKGKVSLPGIAVTNGYSKEMSVMPNDSHDAIPQKRHEGTFPDIPTTVIGEGGSRLSNDAAEAIITDSVNPSTTQEDDNDKETLLASRRSPKPVKRIRNRSPLSLVQAHLSKAKENRLGMPPSSTAVPEIEIDSICNRKGKRPALLSRISDAVISGDPRVELADVPRLQR